MQVVSYPIAIINKNTRKSFSAGFLKVYKTKKGYKMFIFLGSKRMIYISIPILNLILSEIKKFNRNMYCQPVLRKKLIMNLDKGIDVVMGEKRKRWFRTSYDNKYLLLQERLGIISKSEKKELEYRRKFKICNIIEHEKNFLIAWKLKQLKKNI